MWRSQQTKQKNNDLFRLEIEWKMIRSMLFVLLLKTVIMQLQLLENHARQRQTHRSIR